MRADFADLVIMAGQKINGLLKAVLDLKKASLFTVFSLMERVTFESRRIRAVDLAVACRLTLAVQTSVQTAADQDIDYGRRS